MSNEFHMLIAAKPIEQGSCDHHEGFLSKSSKWQNRCEAVTQSYGPARQAAKLPKGCLVSGIMPVINSTFYEAPSINTGEKPAGAGIQR